MKKTIIVLLIISAVILMTITSCAAGPNEFKGLEDVEGDVAGFFMGLWHGFIALFTFIISLFSDKVNVYEIHNNGGWYNFGFILGVSAFFGGGGKGSSRGSRKWKERCRD